MRISVVGLGKLGLSMATAITHKGHHVVGIDISETVLEKIRVGKSPIDEPWVQDYLTEARQNKLLTVTQDIQTAIHGTDVTLVAVNTPERPDGLMDLEQVADACRSIAFGLREKTDFHVIVINSTIMPETVDQILIPTCESASGKKAGKDFGICVNPVWIALTTVIHDFISPPVIVIGETDDLSGDLVAGLYSRICEKRAPVLRTTPLMAEMIKMAHNAFVTAKMAFVNELADACTRIPGADIRAVTEFFKMGGERSGKFLEAGMGFGGPCFPRDLRFFTNYLNQQLGRASLLESIDTANDDHAIRIVELLEEELDFIENRHVAVLGISYKPNSNIIERSFTLKLVELLIAKGAKVRVFDPNVRAPSEKNGAIAYSLCQNIEESLEEADACILATPWEELKSLGPDFYQKWMKRTVLLDPWRSCDAGKFSHALDRYVAFGIGLTPLETSKKLRSR